MTKLRYTDSGHYVKQTPKLYTTHKLNWVDTDVSLDILGVKVCLDKDQLMDANFSPLIQKMRTILKNWQSRGLSIAAKICMVNSLIFSTFVYKQTVLPLTSTHLVNTINRIVESFIWNDKKPKIPLKALHSLKVDGGFGLVNLHNRDLALKASWVSFLNMDSMVAEFAHLALDLYA